MPVKPEQESTNKNRQILADDRKRNNIRMGKFV